VPFVGALLLQEKLYSLLAVVVLPARSEAKKLRVTGELIVNAPVYAGEVWVAAPVML
jgi:hypothetical protein